MIKVQFSLVNLVRKERKMKIRISIVLLIMIAASFLGNMPVEAKQPQAEVDSVLADTTYSISGRVMDQSEMGIAGVQIHLVEENLKVYLPIIARNVSSAGDVLSDIANDGIVSLNDSDDYEAFTTTDSNGNYIFENVPLGRYQITASIVNRSFFPTHRYVVTPPNAVYQNFYQDDIITIEPLSVFEIGCDPDHNDGIACEGDELPHHRVALSPYAIDRMEVTNYQYQLCVAEGVCEAPDYVKSKTVTEYYGTEQYKDYPVIYVSWYDAYNFCNWAGKRLPTEAEWESAARVKYENDVTPDIAYPWGDTTPDCNLANHYYTRVTGDTQSYEYCVGDTSEVDSYPTGASRFNVLNLAGNVKEWVNDWYSPSYYNNLATGILNPPGPSIGEYKVIRGGAFNSKKIYLLTADRQFDFPERSYYDVGFRCSYPIPEEEQ